jgi:ABC-type multidrug transport system ATPase subunit
MSEPVLRALMQLFALIGDIHEDTVITVREKDIVRKFLLRHLNNELVEKYMELFEAHLSQYNSESVHRGSVKDRKRISLNAMRILSLCERISEELHQKQKIYVLVKLIDYISLGAEITYSELDFLRTVSDSFNIPVNEFKNILGFIIANEKSEIDISRILVIDSKQTIENASERHITNENLKGTITFLDVQDTNTCLMRYIGGENLYLNGQTIHEDETYVFDHGSSLRGSGIRAIYYSEVISHLASSFHKKNICLEVNDVFFRFRKSENGIHDLKFKAESGELAGILGSSGAGKTTALSILNGTLQPHNGSVLINGLNLYDEYDREKLAGIIGFVPQDDLLIEELSVYQNLYYNAKMCLNNLSEEHIRATVEKILYDLDLFEARDLKVGHPLKKVISGGQRKRINIALELLREPEILFADEPTSGLSSSDSELVMTLLKDLTYKGKLVIVNIHQPSSEIYKMFDKILIIDRGGFQIFSGNPTEAIIYFKTQANHADADEDQCFKCGNVDTEQILKIIEAKVLDEHGKATHIRKVTPPEWARRFMENSGGKESAGDCRRKPLPANNFSIPGRLKQSVIFLRRDILSKLSDRQYLVITLLGSPLLALLLAWFIKTPAREYSFSENENITAYLFMSVITSMFFGLMVSSQEIVSDRKILKRESFLNLSWFSYLNAKVMVMFLVSAIQTLSFVIAGNLILDIKGMTLNYFLVLFTTSCFSNILGLNLSSAFRSVVSVYIFIPFIIIPQLLFSGVLVKFGKLHIKSYYTDGYVPVLGDMMIARWAYEALATKQFKDNLYEKLFFRYDIEISRNEWNSMYLIDNLKKDLWLNYRFRNNADQKEMVVSNFRKLESYSGALSQYAGLALPDRISESFRKEEIDSELFEETSKYLDVLKFRLIEMKKNSVALKDSIVTAYLSEYGKQRLVDLRNDYENRRLKSNILAEDELEKTIETPDKIIRRYQPGFMPAESKTGRAHFYAPVKQVGSQKIDTYYFNIMFIWIFSVILYLILYLRIPEKLLSFFENLRLSRSD